MNPSEGQTPPGGVPPDGTAPRPGDYSAPGIEPGVPPQPAPQPPVWQQPAQETIVSEPVPPVMPPEPPPAPVQVQKAKRGGGRIWLTAIASAVIGALLVLLAMPAIFGVNPYDLVRGKLKKATTAGSTEKPGRTAGVVSPTQGASDVSAIAKAVTPSVVNIDIRTAPQQTPFFTTEPQQGTGSGIIFSTDGYIITNNHVVSDAQDITVTLASGEELKAKKVGTDPENDIAVVKVEKSGLPAIQVGNSDTLVVGELVVAVGSPFGFEQTVTSGIISALHRVIAAGSSSGQQPTVLTDLIQTDATINPGNSGGALCDGDAKLVGINAVIASQSGGSEGIGFAIPVNTAKQVADDLIAGRPVSHPYLGVLGQTVSETIAKRYSLPVSEGAYVTRVVPGSPAEKVGLKAGDIIVGIDGKPVKSMDDVIGAVRSRAVGAQVSVTYYSGESKKNAKVTLAERPAGSQ